MLQTIKYGKNTTVMTGNESSRAKAMAAGKKAKKAAAKQKGMTPGVAKNRKGYGDHLAGQDEGVVKNVAKKVVNVAKKAGTAVEKWAERDAAKRLAMRKRLGQIHNSNNAASEEFPNSSVGKSKSQKQRLRKKRADFNDGSDPAVENVGEAATKRPMSPAQKKRHAAHQKLLKLTGAKKSKSPRKAARGKTEISKTASRYEDIEREIDEMMMDETHAPGNTTTKKNPDFDERQGMYNSNYKRIHKKNPSRGEMRSAGVGKGGDNAKGVKAWKSAMAALKASEGRR
jgi:hypothetical protein